MGFFKNLLTTFFMKPFKPNLLESEEYNHKLFLKHHGTEELWQAMKSQWVFADNSKSEFYDHYKYDEMNKRTYSLESKHIKLREQIESDWSILYNTKCFYGPLADTFEQVAHQWEEYALPSKEQARRHQVAFERRFTDLYERPIKSITRAQLVAWRAELANSDQCGTKIKNDTISFVKGVFRYYSTVYNVVDNSVILKRLKKTDKEIMQEMNVWTVDEFNQFLSCVDSPLYALFFETLFWTGARRGEIMALQKSDFKDGWINIHASQKHHKNGLKPTKTKATRVVQLDDKLIEDIQPLLNGNGYLFGGNHGLSITQIQMQFKKAIKASGVKNIRLHDLRHSHATILINNGVNIVAVSKRLGHSDIETTLKTYTHLLSDTNKELIDKINAIKT